MIYQNLIIDNITSNELESIIDLLDNKAFVSETNCRYTRYGSDSWDNDTYVDIIIVNPTDFQLKVMCAYSIEINKRSAPYKRINPAKVRNTQCLEELLQTSFEKSDIAYLFNIEKLSNSYDITHYRENKRSEIHSSKFHKYKISDDSKYKVRDFAKVIKIMEKDDICSIIKIGEISIG